MHLEPTQSNEFIDLWPDALPPIEEVAPLAFTSREHDLLLERYGHRLQKMQPNSLVVFIAVVAHVHADYYQSTNQPGFDAQGSFQAAVKALAPNWGVTDSEAYRHCEVICTQPDQDFCYLNDLVPLLMGLAEAVMTHPSYF